MTTKPMFRSYSLLISFVLFSVSFMSCDNNHEYDNAYEAAWNEEGAPTIFSSQEYRDGYEQGLLDASMYDEGYYDGYNRVKCAYPNDPDYMDGFKDGSKSRKCY